jgi:hypothetical protein
MQDRLVIDQEINKRKNFEAHSSYFYHIPLTKVVSCSLMMTTTGSLSQNTNTNHSWQLFVEWEHQIRGKIIIPTMRKTANIHESLIEDSIDENFQCPR